MRRFAGAGGRRRGGSRRRLQLGACAADIVQIRRVLGQTVVERMADFEASGADKIDALDSLVDSLAIQDSPAQLLDSNSEQLAILAFDLPSSGFVLGKICIFVRLVRHIAERRVLVTLGRLAFARSTHSYRPPTAFSACVRQSRKLSRIPGRSPCVRSPQTWSPCCRRRSWDTDVSAGGRHSSRRFSLFSLP